jgi:hypothetical protein
MTRAGGVGSVMDTWTVALPTCRLWNRKVAIPPAVGAVTRSPMAALGATEETRPIPDVVTCAVTTVPSAMAPPVPAFTRTVNGTNEFGVV